MSGTTRRILVAEDSPTQAEQLRQLLEDGGYTVTVAANGRQALASAHQDPPTLVISDIVMPEMDGYALCREIKSDEALKDTPVILVTVLSSPHDIVSALECGADSVIRKPYDESDLLSRLSYIQANRELRKSEKMQLGVEIDVAGRRYFIGAERRQILDLLISTYEEAIVLNAELAARQGDLERSSQFLQGLYRIAKALNAARSEQEAAEAALERALELPGVQAGWISLREGEAGFRLVAARGLPPALAAPDAMEGDCLCRRSLRSGEATQATNILDCERLQRAQGDTGGLRYHASIPLWVGDRTLGVMNLAGPGPGRFRDEDLKILNGVGNQVAIALERARLLEHLEDEVRRRTAALSAEITERERAEEALRRTEKLAAMGGLLAGVAHELNNPLSVVLGHAALLHRAAGPGPLGARAEKITRAAERCGRIVSNFLALARQHPSERQQVALNRIAQEAVELLAYPLRVDTVEVTLDLASDVPDLWADPHQLHQVVVNLVTNAHHAMRETPPPRRLTLATRVDPAPTRVALEVSDTGPGIPPEIQARVFEPFFTTKPPGQGTGLGLSLCQGIIEAHGGSISLESSPGRGATFRVELPIGTLPAAGQDAPTAVTSAPVPRKTILVVDDEMEVADLLAEMLSADGHEVETAANGAIALEKLRERFYDLVLSDLRMPELDGPGLYREVERRHPRLARRFVFLTGDTLSPEITKFLEDTRAVSLNKPFAVEEVRRAVERAVRAGARP